MVKSRKVRTTEVWRLSRFWVVIDKVHDADKAVAGRGGLCTVLPNSWNVVVFAVPV